MFFQVPMEKKNAEISKKTGSPPTLSKGVSIRSREANKLAILLQALSRTCEFKGQKVWFFAIFSLYLELQSGPVLNGCVLNGGYFQPFPA